MISKRMKMKRLFKQFNTRPTLVGIQKGNNEGENIHGNSFLPQGNTLLSNDEQFNLNGTNVLNNITGNNYQNNNLKNSDFNTDSQQFQNYSQNFTNQNFTNQRGNNYSLMNQNLRTNIIQDFKCKSFPDFKGNMPNLIQNEKAESFYTDYKKFLENFLHEDRNIKYKISIY